MKRSKVHKVLSVLVVAFALSLLLLYILSIFNINLPPRLLLFLALVHLMFLFLLLALGTLYEGIKGIYKGEMRLVFKGSRLENFAGIGPYIAKGYYALVWGIIYVIISMALFVLIGFVLFLFLAP